MILSGFPLIPEVSAKFEIIVELVLTNCVCRIITDKSSYKKLRKTILYNRKWGLLRRLQLRW